MAPSAQDKKKAEEAAKQEEADKAAAEKAAADAKTDEKAPEPTPEEKAQAEAADAEPTELSPADKAIAEATAKTSNAAVADKSGLPPGIDVEKTLDNATQGHQEPRPPLEPPFQPVDTGLETGPLGDGPPEAPGGHHLAGGTADSAVDYDSMTEAEKEAHDALAGANLVPAIEEMPQAVHTEGTEGDGRVTVQHPDGGQMTIQEPRAIIDGQAVQVQQIRTT